HAFSAALYLSDMLAALIVNQQLGALHKFHSMAKFGYLLFAANNLGVKYAGQLNTADTGINLLQYLFCWHFQTKKQRLLWLLTGDCYAFQYIQRQRGFSYRRPGGNNNQIAI